MNTHDKVSNKVSTRRSKGDGTVYQRADGRWVARVYVGDKPKTVYARTEPLARKALTRLRDERARSALVVAAPTVEQWLTYWRTEVLDVRPSTRAGYDTYLDKHIIPRIGPHRLDRLEPAHVRRLYAAMRKAGLAEASIRQTHAILSRALKVAEREGKVARNVATLVDPPSTVANPRTPLTVAQARKVLQAAEPDASRWYAALWLGLRQGEALGLTWGNVNLDAGFVVIDQAIQRQKGKGLVVVPVKSRSSNRVVPLPPMVLSRLKVHAAMRLAAGATDDWYVWGGARPTDPSRDYKAWKALLVKAKVPTVALHAARNTTGTLLMAAGVPDKVAAEITGHGTVQVLQDHYQRADLGQRTEAMLALEQYAG